MSKSKSRFTIKANDRNYAVQILDSVTQDYSTIVDKLEALAEYIHDLEYVNSYSDHRKFVNRVIKKSHPEHIVKELKKINYWQSEKKPGKNIPVFKKSIERSVNSSKKSSKDYRDEADKKREEAKALKKKIRDLDKKAKLKELKEQKKEYNTRK